MYLQWTGLNYYQKEQIIYNELGSISTKKSSMNDATPPDSSPQALGNTLVRLVRDNSRYSVK
jgi:hypothetical protein